MSDTDSTTYKDNPEFNQSIDDEFGDIEIFKTNFAASLILAELRPDLYEARLKDHKREQFKKLQDMVFSKFPALIAYNYRLSEKGPGANDPIKAFLHLKDAWEGTINLLNALAFGEIRKKQIDLKGAKVFHSGNPELSFKPKIIRTDELKQRLENVRAIVQFAKEAGMNLICEQIQPTTLNLLYQLQDNRNHFSHTATPTREQAESQLNMVRPIFEQVLREVDFLENVRICRFESLKKTCNFEIFQGHHLNKEYFEASIDAQELAYVSANAGDIVFAIWVDEIISLSPFLHFKNDDTGHQTFLCFFKGRKGEKSQFEPLKLRQELTFDSLQGRFDSEFKEIESLVVPSK